MRHPIIPGLGLFLAAMASVLPARAADLVDTAANYQELRQAAALIPQNPQQAIARAQLLDQVSGGRCGECQVVLAQAYLAAGDRAQAAAAAESALGLLSDLGRQASANATLAYALVDPQDTRGNNLP